MHVPRKNRKASTIILVVLLIVTSLVTIHFMLNEPTQVQANPSYEDFLNDFTESNDDANPNTGLLRQTTTRASWVTLERQDNPYLHRDYGAGYFSGTFQHDFDLNITDIDASGSVSSRTLLNIYQLRMSSPDPSQDTDEIRIYATEIGTSSTTYKLVVLCRDGDATVDYGNLQSGGDYTFSVDTMYYMRLERDGSNQFNCSAYSDSDRTSLVASDLISGSADAYRYCQLTSTWGWGTDPTDDSTGYIESFDLHAIDATNPLWQNVGPQNGTAIQSGANITLYSQGYDETALDWAWLSTNETGSWKNHTSIHVVNWTKESSNPVWEMDNITWTSTQGLGDPAILRSPVNGTALKYNGVYWMAYFGKNATGKNRIALANSTNLVDWYDVNYNPILEPNDGDAEPWEIDRHQPQDFLYMGDEDGVNYTFWLFYLGYNSSSFPADASIGIAKTNNMTTWIRDTANNPIADWTPDWAGAWGIEDWRLQKMSNGSWVAIYEPEGFSGDGVMIGAAYTADSLPDSGWSDEGRIMTTQSEGADFDANPTIIRYEKNGITYYEIIFEWGTSGSIAKCYEAYANESAVFDLDGWTRSDYNPIIPNDDPWEDSSTIPDALIEKNGSLYCYYTGDTGVNRALGLSVGPHLLDMGTAKYYDSPMDMNDASTSWEWSNFTWSNSSIDVGTIIQWKIYYNDTSGNENVTDTYYFMVVPPPVPYTGSLKWALIVLGGYNYYQSDPFYGSIQKAEKWIHGRGVPYDLIEDNNIEAPTDTPSVGKFPLQFTNGTIRYQVFLLITNAYDDGSGSGVNYIYSAVGNGTNALVIGSTAALVPNLLNINAGDVVPEAVTQSNSPNCTVTKSFNDTVLAYSVDDSVLLTKSYHRIPLQNTTGKTVWINMTWDTTWGVGMMNYTYYNSKVYYVGWCADEPYFIYPRYKDYWPTWKMFGHAINFAFNQIEQMKVVMLPYKQYGGALNIIIDECRPWTAPVWPWATIQTARSYGYVYEYQIMPTGQSIDYSLTTGFPGGYSGSPSSKTKYATVFHEDGNVMLIVYNSTGGGVYDKIKVDLDYDNDFSDEVAYGCWENITDVSWDFVYRWVFINPNNFVDPSYLGWNSIRPFSEIGATRINQMKDMAENYSWAYDFHGWMGHHSYFETVYGTYYQFNGTYGSAGWVHNATYLAQLFNISKQDLINAFGSTGYGFEVSFMGGSDPGNIESSDAASLKEDEWSWKRLVPVRDCGWYLTSATDIPRLLAYDEGSGPSEPDYVDMTKTLYPFVAYYVHAMAYDSSINFTGNEYTSMPKCDNTKNIYTFWSQMKHTLQSFTTATYYDGTVTLVFEANSNFTEFVYKFPKEYEGAPYLSFSDNQTKASKVHEDSESIYIEFSSGNGWHTLEVNYGEAFNASITVDTTTHSWTINPGQSNVTIIEGTINITVSANKAYSIQVKGSGNLTHTVLSQETIDLSNVLFHEDTLGSADSLTTSYQDVGGLVNQTAGTDVELTFKLWLSVPDGTRAGDYTYTLSIQIVEYSP